MLKTDSFIKRKYNKLYLAALLGWLIAIIGEMADSVLAGLLVSEEAVAAVELVVPLGTLTYAIALPISCGAAIVYSRFAGAFDTDRAYKAAFESVAASVVLGIVVATVMMIGKETFLDYYGVSDSIRTLASDYYDAYMAIAVLEPVFWCIYQLVLVDGDEGLTLFIDISMTVINAGASFVLGSIMGVEGLAIGTLASYVLTFGALLIHFRKKTNSIHFKKYFRIKEIGEMAYNGSSSALNNVYLAVIDIIMNKFIVDQFGDKYLSAYAVVNVVMNLAAVLICSVDGSKAFVTVGIGEKNNYAVKRIMRIAIISEIISSVVATILLQFLAPLWPDLYDISSPEVISAATFAGRVVPLTYLAAAFVYAFEIYYPSIGEVLLGNILSVGYMLIGPIVLAIPLAYICGFNGMTIGFALTPVFALLVELVFLLFVRKGRKIPLLLSPSDETAVSYDLWLKPENISQVCGKINEYLVNQGVEGSVSNQAQLIVEETFMQIAEKNHSKKVMADVTVLVSPSRVRLITRDNGVIFNITDVDAKIKDLRCYVLSQLMLSADESTYATTISFNRNMYIWERENGQAAVAE